MVVVLGVVLRAWRSGEFVSKAVHDQILAATTQRYTDLLERFNNQQAAIEKWREQAERAAKTAEAAQTQHAQLLSAVVAVERAVEEFRDDFHGARVWHELGPPDAPEPGPRNRRPGAREGG